MKLLKMAAVLLAGAGLSGCVAIWAVGTAAETAGNVAVGTVKGAGAVAGAAAGAVTGGSKEDDAR